MEILDKEELKIYLNDYFKHLNEGELFIYPTDTIYGIGCDATNESSVKKLRDLKKRPSNPFSIIAPSKEWILNNCEVKEEDLDFLPGPVTLVVKLKGQPIAKNVSSETVGVRIPNHWISEVISKFNKPIITTSVNLQGENHASSLDSVHSDFHGHVRFAVDEGEKVGRPSKIINLISNEVRER